MTAPKTASTVVETSVRIEKHSTAKLDTIREIERQTQKLWADSKIFEVDAPTHFTDK